MRIDFHSQFKKHYQKRIRPYTGLRKKYQERVSLWMNNQKDSSLKDHKLSGKLVEYRAFWITGDVRVTYKIINSDTVQFYDVGSHNQVY